jgi:hypothetical protein
VGLPAERGAGGYSVLGFWQPGAADPTQAFTSLLSQTAWTAERFVKAVDEFIAGLAHGRPTTPIPARLLA